MTEEGMKRVNPDFIPSDLFVYLDSSDDITTVMSSIKDQYSDLQLNVINMEEEFDTILESFNRAITALCIGCIIVTLLIISLVLYLLIKIRLIKERMRIGVFKALGYTTKQLILQIICSFFPVCVLGALFGTILAMYLINPILAALLSVAGSIQNCHFAISPVLGLVTFLSISLFSVIITGFVARAVRKITPCELFQ
jgi:putative ABC transport system permease protein